MIAPRSTVLLLIAFVATVSASVRGKIEHDEHHFSNFDKNKDGYIDQKEAKAVLGENIEDFFSVEDKDGDGRVSHAEFLGAKHTEL